MTRTILLLIVFILFTGVCHHAAACVCAESTIPEALQQSKVVFLGKVTGKHKSNAVFRDGVEVAFRVDRVWKGGLSKTALVYTGATEDLYPFLDLCAPLLRKGHRYIVFAYGKEKFATDICTHTAEVRKTRTIAKQLGRGRPPGKLRH